MNSKDSSSGICWRLPVIVLVMAVTYTVTTFASPRCNSIFIDQNRLDRQQSSRQTEFNKSNSQDFTFYISDLLDQRIISIDDLIKFNSALEKDILVNPVPHEKNSLGVYFTKSANQIHYEALQRMIDEGNLKTKEILKSLKELIRQKENSRDKRERVQGDTYYANQKMEFNRVEPGEFIMGKEKVKTKVIISKPFEMMSTHVTQIMWVQIQIALGETDVSTINPSSFKTGKGSQRLKVKDFEINLQPDNPVENIAWEEAKDFIEGLNRISKSDDPQIQHLLENIIVGHKKGDEYDFPTEAQWEFVVRNRGRANKLYVDRDDLSELSRYAWFYPDAEGQTHPVAQLKPRIVEGKEFYDLQGNVHIWVKDIHQNNLMGGIDPQGPPKGTDHVYRGGSYNSLWPDMKTSERFSESFGMTNSTIGLRLIRKVREITK